MVVFIVLIEIDHCDLGTDNCGDNATCYYTSPNQFDCICNEGFTGDGVYCEGEYTILSNCSASL